MEFFDFFSGFVLKTLFTGGILLAASLAAERAGVLIAAIIVTLPLNAGPGFLFVALDTSPEFLARGGLASFSATFAVHTFTTVYAWASGRLKGFWLVWAAAVAAWLLISIPLLQFNLTLTSATIVVACGFGLSHLLRDRRFDQGSAPTHAARQVSIRFLIVRALIGGSIVALTASAAKFLGPDLTGLGFAFPVMLTASAWMLYTAYGPTFSAATISNTRKGLVSYVSFCFSIAVLPPLMGNLPAWFAAVGISVAITLLLVYVPRLTRSS
ncbi:MAG: hypothetical protein HN725_07150 [Alphaproteobacteria bacterium]|nr:hypothetical protein [Alphaproteobacteria bacterium]MBT4084144.1 hypothetical protein [Alphaproteobacteria bacterium]MBT4546513.1 hypothetical protein [Alphaproteobacteria bacterium]MBT7745054.1 hypothetical protein [Alphaproteobacteria bacterium]